MVTEPLLHTRAFYHPFWLASSCFQFSSHFFTNTYLMGQLLQKLCSRGKKKKKKIFRFKEMWASALRKSYPFKEEQMKFSHTGSLIILLKKGKWHFHTQETQIKKVYTDTDFFFSYIFIFNIGYFSWKKRYILLVSCRKSSVTLMSIFVLSPKANVLPVCQYKLRGPQIISFPIFLGVCSWMCFWHVSFFCCMCLSDIWKWLLHLMQLC